MQKFLLNAGADIHSIDNEGQTVLYNLYSDSFRLLDKKRLQY